MGPLKDGQFSDGYTIKKHISIFCKKPTAISPGHNQNWIYSDVIELHKMAPTLRDAIGRHISALFSALKCSFPTVLWEPYLWIIKKTLSGEKMASVKDFTRFYTWNRWNRVGFRARIFLTRPQTFKERRYVAIFPVFQKIRAKSAYNFLEFRGIFVLVHDFLA